MDIPDEFFGESPLDDCRIVYSSRTTPLSRAARRETLSSIEYNTNRDDIYTMFWSSDLVNTPQSRLDVLLQEDSVKLSDILFEEDLLQELKCANENLSKFIKKPEIIDELINNIVRLTQDDCDEKILCSPIHAAYVSCEILTTGLDDILFALAANSSYINRIIACLSETPVIQRKITLLAKLINDLHGLSADTLATHFEEKPEEFCKMVATLVDNIDISGSYEILSTLLKSTSFTDVRHRFCNALRQADFVRKLIDVMTLSEAEDKQRNACQLLCDIITINRHETCDLNNLCTRYNDCLALYIGSEEAVQVMLEQMFSKEQTDTTAIVCGMKVLRTLLDFVKPLTEFQWSFHLQTIDNIQGVVEKYIENFHELLKNPPKQDPIKSTFGIIQKPLGFLRLEAVNLIKALLKTNSPVFMNKLVEIETMKVIIDLFIDYPWNNLLHTQVEQILTYIIRNYGLCEENRDGPSKALFSQLLNECDLIGRLLMPKCTTNSGTNRSEEKANFGHIIKMINSIATRRNFPIIKEHLEEMESKRPELFDRWTTFVNVDVASFQAISRLFNSQIAQNCASKPLASADEIDFQIKMLSTYDYDETPGTNGVGGNKTDDDSSTATADASKEANTGASGAKAAAAAATNGDVNTAANNKDSPAAGKAESYEAMITQTLWTNAQEDEGSVFAYLSFKRETVLPTINVNVLP